MVKEEMTRGIFSNRSWSIIVGKQLHRRDAILPLKQFLSKDVLIVQRV